MTMETTIFGTTALPVPAEALTMEKLHQSEELLYSPEMKYLDDRYGKCLFIVAHTDAKIPRPLTVWAHRDNRPIYRSRYLQSGDIIYSCNVSM